MLILSSFVLPLFAVIGYAHHIGRSAVYGGLEAPRFGGFFDRFIDGLMVTVVLAALTSLFLALSFVVVDTGDWLRLTDTEMEGAILIALLFTSYVTNGFLTVHAATDSITETFTTGRVRSFVTSKYYLKAWLLQFVVLLGVLLVGATTAVTIVGVLFWTPFALTAFASYWGRVYKQAMDKGIVEPVNVDVEG